MNAPFDPSELAAEKFAVGQPVSRKEDPVLLRGEGRYTDDLNLPWQLHAVMVRSRMAHGHLRGIDLSEAATMPGVLAIYTAADLQSAGIKPMAANVAGANRDGSPIPKPTQYALATDKVRYVGDPIAVVIAETAKQVGAPIALAGFARIAVGEGVEKKSEDFAAEVAAISGGA